MARIGLVEAQVWKMIFLLLFFSRPAVSDSLQTAARQASLPLTISWSLPKFMFIVSVGRPAISSSDILFSFCPRSFPASGTFPVSHLFTSDDQISHLFMSDDHEKWTIDF